MEVKERRIAVYSQRGHHQFPEDTWKEECIVENHNDLYEFMKDIYRHDANSFNDYPFNGTCEMNLFSFYIEQYIDIDGVLFTDNARIKVHRPVYFEQSKELFNVFIDRVNRTLPVMRAAFNKARTEDMERKKLAKLKLKYESQ